MSNWQQLRDRLGLTLRPLHSWPGALTPAHRREAGPFSAPLKDTLEVLARELRALSARGVVLQLALREGEFRRDGLPRAGARAEHPGVVLSFESRHGPLRLHHDRFTAWEQNLRAIAKHLEHLRLSSLYGVGRDGEQYRGWQALPAGEAGATPAGPAAAAGPEAVINELAGTHVGTLSERYRLAVRRCHPDVCGGDERRFRRLQEAWNRLQGASV